MRKSIIAATLLCFSALTHAQFYPFEDGVVPAEWQAATGDALSVSQEHYKDDTYSLAWTTAGNRPLTISFPSSFGGTAGVGASLQIYSTRVSDDVLKVEFISTTNLVVKTANFKLNFKGWRDFTRRYSEYASSGSNTIAKARFTLLPAASGNTPRTLYFDKMEFNATVSDNRTIGTPWVDDISFFGTANNVTPLRLYAQTNTIPASAATAAESNDLNLLRTRFGINPTPPTPAILADATAFVDGLNITRNADGSLKGTPLNNSPAALTSATMTDYAVKLEAIAHDYLTNTADDTKKARFNLFFDHLIDQGIAEGCAFSIGTTDYTNARNIPQRFLNALPACSDDQKIELIKLVRWISYYCTMYYGEADYLKNLNSDIIYLYLPYFTACAVHHPDTDTAVRELKTLKRFLERNTRYVPGGNDILKVDGTGFHHNTHYNNYMYAYQTWIDHMHGLRGTVFQIDADSYHRFKKAILSIYRMATTGSSDAYRFYALSLAGRNPFASGQSLFFNQARFEKLIELGSTVRGAIDEELAGAYNHFYNSNKYPVPARKQDGFYQFNYSPAAIYRKDNWVVTMRAPTTKCWGAEIYANKNRFGRYQSHGTLEVMYSGNSLMKSGYPTNGTGGGWDWNMPQGATTVNYTTWSALMPGGNLSARFDQWAKTSNFAGALAWGERGIFASYFDQDDYWGNQQFTPTNLRFKKSMFAYDGVILSLGSDIAAQGNYSSAWHTLTTLFQNLYSSNFSTQPLVVNGTTITTVGHTASLDANTVNWMVSPAGTGYLLPAGNDATTISLALQKTPKENGADFANPTVEATAAKCYIDHGAKPSNGDYEFLVVPAANNASMQDWAQNYGNRIRINQKDALLHSVTFLTDNTHAYTFFGAMSGLTFGRVKSANGRLLLMEKTLAEENRVLFAASCPDLNPVPDADYGWRSSPRNVDVVLAGEWQVAQPVEGVHFSTPAGNETAISLTFSNGEPIYFDAVPYGTSLKEEAIADQVFDYEPASRTIRFKQPGSSDRTLALYTLDGKALSQHRIPHYATTYTIEHPHTNQPFLIGRLSSSEYVVVFKVPQTTH